MMTLGRFPIQRQPVVGMEDEVERQERRATPIEEFYASLPARIMDKALKRRRAVYLTEYAVTGRRGQAGAIIVDFFFTDRPLILEVYGEQIHERGSLEDQEREERIREIYPDRRLAIIWDTEIFNEDYFEMWMRQNVDAALFYIPTRLGEEEEQEWLQPPG